METSKAAGQTVAAAGSKVKAPLIAAGTAIAGVAAGVVIKDRLGATRSKNPLKRMGSVSMPKPDLGNLDLDKIKSAAERVSAYGQQAADIAKAVEKTQKKNK